MRVLATILLCLVLHSDGLCQGQSNDSLFLRAQALEQEMQFGAACVIYDTLVQRGHRVDEIQSMRIYRMHRQLEDKYKLERDAGDTAFALSKYAEAQEAYLRASALKPDDEYVRSRIAKINELLGK